MHIQVPTCTTQECSTIRGPTWQHKVKFTLVTPPEPCKYYYTHASSVETVIGFIGKCHPVWQHYCSTSGQRVNFAIAAVLLILNRHPSFTVKAINVKVPSLLNVASWYKLCKWKVHLNLTLYITKGLSSRFLRLPLISRLMPVVNGRLSNLHDSVSVASSMHHGSGHIKFHWPVDGKCDLAKLL